MVNTPEDAYRCFMATGMDVLVVGNFVLQKSAQPRMEGAAEHRQQFEAD
jgi:carbamoyltransferase